MQLRDIYLTLAVVEGDRAKVLYVGPDAGRAQKEYAEAGPGVLEVGVISHPQCVMPRFPRQESEALQKAQEDSEAHELLEVKAAELLLVQLKQQYAELQAQIASLEPKEKATKGKTT